MGSRPPSSTLWSDALLILLPTHKEPVPQPGTQNLRGSVTSTDVLLLSHLRSPLKDTAFGMDSSLGHQASEKKPLSKSHMETFNFPGERDCQLTRLESTGIALRREVCSWQGHGGWAIPRGEWALRGECWPHSTYVGWGGGGEGLNKQPKVSLDILWSSEQFRQPLEVGRGIAAHLPLGILILMNNNIVTNIVSFPFPTHPMRIQKG